MTVLAGLVHRDGVALIADRATVDPFVELTAGMPMPGPPATKLFSSSAGVVAGVAGTVAVAGVDLLARVAEIVAGSTSAVAAHMELVAACEEVAPVLREHRAVSGRVTPFAQPVLAVVLLGGVGSGGAGPQLVAYGIPDAGPTVFQSLQQSVVFAPASVQLDAEVMSLGDDPATPVVEQVDAWGRRLAELAPLSIVRQRVDVSTEWDFVVVSSSGSAGVVHHR